MIHLGLTAFSKSISPSYVSIDIFYINLIYYKKKVTNVDYLNCLYFYVSRTVWTKIKKKAKEIGKERLRFMEMYFNRLKSEIYGIE